MKSRRQVKISTVLYMALLITSMGWVQQNAIADSEPQSAPAENVQLSEEQAAAKDMIMRMAEFLAKTQRFSVNLNSSYEVLQDSGQMIEFGEHRKIIVSRPNGLRVEVDHGGGDKHIIQYDGKEITVFSPSLNVYAQTYKSGGIDEAVKYFLRDLGMRLPLAVLLISKSAEEIDRRTQVFNYVEDTVIDGVPVHHLAGRTETVDYQVWIPEGAQPLPLRIVLTYKNAEGQPTHRVQFSDWNLTPKVKDSQFAFTPSEGARKITFLARLPKIVLEGPTKPEQTGESK
jgi:hypothetical protein